MADNNRTCFITACEKAHYANGMCGTHYRASKPPCTFSGCNKPAHAKGYCGQHYRRAQRHGDVNATAIIVGDDTARFAQYVRKTSTCWNWIGDKGPGGYGNFSINGREKKSHRVSYEWNIGKIPPGMEIDHRCHNRACVNPEHLRPVTRKQNMENLSGTRSDSRIGIRGVTWIERNQKWRARCGHNGKDIHVGMFTSASEAEEAIIAKRNELYTHNDLDRIKV